MHEETMINQQAQDHAVACALFAGLLGQLAPSFMRLPVLNKNLDEPPQRLALDNIERPPAQVGRDQIAIGLFALRISCATMNRLVLWEQTYNRALPTDGHHLFAPTDADGVGRPGMGGKIVGDVLFALVHARLF